MFIFRKKFFFETKKWILFCENPGISAICWVIIGCYECLPLNSQSLSEEDLSRGTFRVNSGVTSIAWSNSWSLGTPPRTRGDYQLVQPHLADLPLLLRCPCLGSKWWPWWRRSRSKISDVFFSEFFFVFETTTWILFCAHPGISAICCVIIGCKSVFLFISIKFGLYLV